MKNIVDIRKNISIPAWLFLIFSVFYDEMLILFWVADTIAPGRFAAVAAFALGCGALLAVLISLIPSPKVCKWVSVAAAVVLAVLYMVEYFCNDAYQTFMAIATLLDGADGVATSFLDVVASLILQDLWRIGLILLPIVIFAVFGNACKVSWKKRAPLAVCAVVLYLLGFGTVLLATGDANRLDSAYDFDSAVRCFGLNVALVLDATHDEAEMEEELDFAVSQPAVPAELHTEATEPAMETEAQEDAEVVYGVNALDIDYSALAESEANSYVASLHSYVASLTPSSQNAYTGIFEGKNLIFITAEAFSAEVIDPELTPTLYRLANEGIQFTDYYQPLWGGSTSTGEFSNLVGLAAANATRSIKEANQQDLFLTMGNQLQDLGYGSFAYHNHLYDYYDRDETHPMLGYGTYMGIGNGLEAGVNGDNWPASDLEMIEFTVEQYINQQPFNVYYMTVSGHAGYGAGNAMTQKNLAAVEHLECSDKLKGYFAAQLELEYALEYLVNRLEEEGTADDTVIVVGADHYPYALQLSATWGNMEDYVAELYGYRVENNAQRDHNALIIWSGSIEDEDIVVDTPVYSLDILPTLSNLFGVEYDSRLLIGRDVFSDQLPLVLWNDYSWLTEMGFYNGTTDKFIPAEGEEVSEEYVEYIHSLVSDKLKFSRAIQQCDYYNYIAPLVAE